MKVSYHALKKENVADFLILTVTERETNMLMPLIMPISDLGIIEAEHDGRIYTLGKIGQFNIIHCKCSDMGTQESGSSILITRNALSDWPCIKGGAMVGIAFGMYDEDSGVTSKQHFSDVLVARKIYPYENQKLKDGQKEFRGEWHEANTTFVKAFEEVSRTWSVCNLYNENVHIEVSPLLSGEKLFDDKDERDKLKLRFNEARGGEMEGIGLASACEDAGIPWILLKGICDFGDGNKKEQKHERQDNAARTAAMALQSVLQREDLLISLCDNKKSQFYYQPNRQIEDLVLFDDYNLDCEPFYLRRPVDDLIHNATKVKGCWVFGKSGVGKTVALIRALELMEVRNVFIDMATMVNQPTERMFRFVYEEICDFFETIPKVQCQQLHEVAKAISEVIEQHVNQGEFYIVIEEIPLSEEHGQQFAEFVQQLCSLIISRYIKKCRVNIKFMLSSIASPLNVIPDTQEKVKRYLGFVPMNEWNSDECLELWRIITDEINYQLEGLSPSEFVETMELSPRRIKDCLRSHSLLNNRQVSKVSIAQL